MYYTKFICYYGTHSHFILISIVNICLFCFFPLELTASRAGQLPKYSHHTSTTTSTVYAEIGPSTTRLVCLYNFNAQAPDDLTVSRGDWLYADLDDQADPDWLWAYAPMSSKCGYVPKAYARPPSTVPQQDSTRHFSSIHATTKQNNAGVATDRLIFDPYMSP